MTTALVIFGIAYLLLVVGRPTGVLVVIPAAALLVFLRVLDSDVALGYIDLNVILLLLGMMVLADVLTKTGVFEWLAVQGARLAKGNGPAILCLLVLVAGVASALIDNVTTVVMLFPVTISLSRVLRVNPVPSSWARFSPRTSAGWRW